MNYRGLALGVALLILSVGLCAQRYLGNNFYFVEFKNKTGCGYSTDKPEEFLSARAIERRVRYNIAVEESDLPVNRTYVKAIEETGVVVWGSTKWKNGVVVKFMDNGEMSLEEWMSKVAELDFVVKEEKREVSGHKHYEEMRNVNKFDIKIDSSYYGDSYAQIKQIGCDVLHAEGYKGQDMVIGVLDAGFLNANNNAFLSPLWDNGQLLGVKDIVRPFDGDVFKEDPHGTMVLSMMGAKKEKVYVGSAPEASYWLIRTEDHSEGVDNLSEEYFWLIGAEWADSVGVDMINSSLGYNRFVEGWMDHKYKDLDGKTTIVTQAAETAVKKGILVVCSAGNDGNTAWKYIVAPADGINVLTVGAVNLEGEIASFSSWGPTADGRVKPDALACGEYVYIVNPFDSSTMPIIRGNGTSFSGPLLAGAVASLWCSNKNLTNMQIVDIVRKSCKMYNDPTEHGGYGIANMKKALAMAKEMSVDEINESFEIYPNPCGENLFIKNMNGIEINEILIYDIYGRMVKMMKNPQEQTIDMNGLEGGVYFIQISSKSQRYSSKFIKR